MYQEIKKKFADLEKKLSNPKIIKDSQARVKIAREHAGLKKAVDLIEEIDKFSKIISDNKNLISSEADSDLKSLAQAENEELEKKVKSLRENLEQEVNPANPQDKKNAIMEIRAGTGGDEAAIFAADLFQMYSRFCENQDWKINIISSNQIGLGGFKEIIFEINGAEVYGHLRREAGTHRVQRIPETEKQGRIHTSAATIAVLPEAEELDIEIKAADLRIDTFCSSGPGGQSVNTTQSAIRVTHLPTGITASCQDQKSQHQNKDKALQVLRSRLLAKQEEERISEEARARKNQIGGGDRSDKIRTYNFPQDRISDHRINKSWHNIGNIMNGHLAEIIKELKEKLP